MDVDQAKDVWEELQESYSVMMGASVGKLDTPVSFETSVSGTRAETEGSIRHICEFIEDQEHGYTTEYEYCGEGEPLPSNEERHRYALTVRGE
jgi:hypothetical protein